MFYARTKKYCGTGLYMFLSLAWQVSCHISVVLILVADGLESGGSGYQHAADSVSR